MTVLEPQRLRELFQQQLKGRLLGMATHRVANHGLQRLLDHAPADVVGEVLSELGPALAEPLARGHPGVLTALLGACRRHPHLQPQALRCLFQAFGCWEPRERRRACVGLLAGLRPFGGGDKEVEGAEHEVRGGAGLGVGGATSLVPPFPPCSLFFPRSPCWAPSPCTAPSSSSTSCISGSPDRSWGACRLCPPPRWSAWPAAPLAATSGTPSLPPPLFLPAPAAASSASSRATSSRWHVTAMAAVSSTPSGPRPPPLPAPTSPRSWPPSVRPCSVTPGWPGPSPLTSSSPVATSGRSCRRPPSAAAGSWDPSWRTEPLPEGIERHPG
ncbi:uncharacterized protein O3Q21_015364 [Podargus strigoides]